MPSDSGRVVELLRDSRAAAGFESPDGLTGFVFPFVEAEAKALFLYHLENRRMYCGIYEVEGIAQGVLLAVASKHLFGPVWLARETVWWIDPAHRGRAALRMLDDYEHWALVEQKCQFAGMAGMGEDPDVAKLYLRRGYRLAETHYLKAS